MALQTFEQLWANMERNWAILGLDNTGKYSLHNLKNFVDTVKRLNVLKCHQMALETFGHLWQTWARKWALVTKQQF